MSRYDLKIEEIIIAIIATVCNSKPVIRITLCFVHPCYYHCYGYLGPWSSIIFNVGKRICIRLEPILITPFSLSIFIYPISTQRQMRASSQGRLLPNVSLPLFPSRIIYCHLVFTSYSFSTYLFLS